MLAGRPASAMCVQESEDSRSSAIRSAYRILLRSSSISGTYASTVENCFEVVVFVCLQRNRKRFFTRLCCCCFCFKLLLLYDSKQSCETCLELKLFPSSEEAGKQTFLVGAIPTPFGEVFPRKEKPPPKWEESRHQL